MKKIVLAVWLIGYCAFAVNADQSIPVIRFAGSVPGEQIECEQPLYFWPDPHSTWELDFYSDAIEITCVHNDWISSNTIAGSACAISGFFELWPVLTVPWSYPDNYRLPFSIEMSTGAGLLVFPINDQIWLLALNSEQFYVEQHNNREQLPADKWQKYVLGEERVEIYHNDILLWPETDVMATSFGSYLERRSSTELYWQPAAIKTSIGTVIEVNLNLAIDNQQYVLLQFSGGLVPQFDLWTLDNHPIEVSAVKQGYIIRIPDLITKEQHTISGPVTASFANGEQQWIKAVRDKHQAVLPIEIERGWFGNSSKVVICAVADGKPAANYSFLLPDGDIARTDAHGRLVFVGEAGLKRIVSSNISNVVKWFDSGINETRYVYVDVSGTVAEKSLATVDLIYNSGLNLEFTLHSPQLEVLLGQKLTMRGRLQGLAFGGSIDREGTAWYVQTKPYFLSQSFRKDGWMWSQSGSNWQANYSANNHKFSVEIRNNLRQKPELKAMSLTNMDPWWNIRFTDKEILVETRICGKNVVLDYKDQSFSGLSIIGYYNDWQLDYSQEGIEVTGWLKNEYCRVNYLYSATNINTSLEVLLNGNKLNWSLLVNEQAGKLTAAVKTEVADNTWSASCISMFTGGGLLAELNTYYRLPVSNQIDVCINWIGQVSRQQLESIWDLAIVLENNRAAAKAGWNNKTGSYVQLGLSLVNWF